MHGENNPIFAGILNKLGMVFVHMGQYEKGIEYYQKCENIQRHTIGQNHPAYAVTLNNLAAAFNNNRQFEMAVKYLKECENIKK